MKWDDNARMQPYGKGMFLIVQRYYIMLYNIARIDVYSVASTHACIWKIIRYHGERVFCEFLDLDFELNYMN